MSIHGIMDHPPTPPNPSPDNRPSSPARAGGASERGNPAAASASGEGADRLTLLAHELGNLLDGSLRSLSLARRSLPLDAHPAELHADDGRKRLDVVQQSLLRMAEIVKAAMRQPGQTHSPATSSIELGEAIFHAVDVLTPVAAAHGVRISTVVSNGLSGVPTGTLYSAIVNGLTNAIESVAAAVEAGSGQTGSVEVFASWTDDGRICITIQDDGVGLPAVPDEAIWKFGFTTKPSGSGLGLSVARAIVQELPDGALRLHNRTDRADPDRPGAVYEITFRPSSAAGANDAAGAA